MARKIRKRKIKKSVPAGLAHIHSPFNNTIVTIHFSQMSVTLL